MSGTSLDGIDIVACEFLFDQGSWSFEIKHHHTFPYSGEWKKKLSDLPNASGLVLSSVNNEYGHLLGRVTRVFIESTKFMPDLVASHGHTVFHQPDRGLTLQIGSGSAIAVETGLPVVADFRSTDVAMGGQGAPLVPIGDKLLFSEFDACLNLGGFANISMVIDNERIAFDICPVNIVMNQLVAPTGIAYDEDGKLARSGNIVPELYTSLNELPFYRQDFPKSLGREWVESVFLPLVSTNQIKLRDLLRTITEHIAFQVNSSVRFIGNCKVLVTGGGAHNHYLVERIRDLGTNEWVIPSNELVDFKEGLIFAFLGILRARREINVYQSVTGGRSDHCAGAIYDPLKN